MQAIRQIEESEDEPVGNERQQTKVPKNLNRKLFNDMYKYNKEYVTYRTTFDVNKNENFI